MEPMNAGPWKDWDEEQWSNATYCPDCGLPMLMVEPEEGQVVGQEICVYCNWVEGELVFLNKQKNKLNLELDQLHKKYDLVVAKIEEFGETIRWWLAKGNLEPQWYEDFMEFVRSLKEI